MVQQAGWKLRKKPLLQFESEGYLLQNSLLPEEYETFVLLRPESDWMKLVYILESDLLYSKPTDISGNLTQNHPHRNI